MNMILTNDRPLADKLRAFSALPAATQLSAPVPPARGRTGLRIAGTLAAAATVGAALWLAPGMVGGVFPASAPADASVSAPGTAQEVAAAAPPPQAGAEAGVRVGAAAPQSEEVTGSGYVVAPQSAPVYARYSGRIAAIMVAPGDRVAAGQALLRIDDPDSRFAAQEAQAAQRSAVLALAAAQISRDQAEAALRRKQALSARGVVSGEQLDDARTAALQAANAAERAAAALAAADLKVRIASARLDALTVRAPIEGTVTTLAAHVGDIAPERSDAVADRAGLLTIARLDRLVIDADVAERALGGLGAGLEGEAVLDAFPGRPFAVRLSRIAPEVNAAKGTVTLRLVLTAPPPGVRPGMAARIRLALAPTN